MTKVALRVTPINERLPLVKPFALERRSVKAENRIYKIKLTAANEFGVTVEELEGKYSPRDVQNARMICYILFAEDGLSHQTIGCAFNRYRPAVTLALKRGKELLLIDEVFKQHFISIQSQLK
jgi:chromosomal replication initiation ATPase DnaA